MGRARIKFIGERGQDAGGLRREWYLRLSQEMLNPDYALFTATKNGNTFQPNPNSGRFNPAHKSYFEFIGRVVGMALAGGELIDASFSRSFYKHILGLKLTIHDLEDIDPDLYKSLIWMLENDDVENILMMTWSISDKFLGQTRKIQLKPNGDTIIVTDDDKHEYVAMIC